MTVRTTRSLYPVTALLMLLLAGCSTIKPIPLPEGLTDQPPADWDQRTEQLSQLDHWQLSGKIAVRQPEDSGSGVINRWLQEGDYYELDLSSAFLGLGHTQLRGQPNFLELRLSNGEVYRSLQPEDLLAAATGWRLPLHSLPWWIRGLTNPASEAETLFDDQGQLALIRQDGWEIHYNRWRDAVPNLPSLPALISASKDDRLVRVAVIEWEPMDSTDAEP